MNNHPGTAPKKHPPKQLWKLFTSTFTLSAFTFGGGYVIIPLMRKKFVEQLHWLEEEEMLDLTAIAQATPGALAVNAAILIGYRVAGIIGALVTVLGTVLPPLLILSVISVFYDFFRNSYLVNLVLKGMAAGVVAVIFDVVVNMGSDGLRKKELLPILVMAAAFLASVVFSVNVVAIIVASGLIGGLYSVYKSRKDGKGAQS